MFPEQSFELSPASVGSSGSSRGTLLLSRHLFGHLSGGFGDGRLLRKVAPSLCVVL